MKKEELAGSNDHIVFCHICDVAGTGLCPQRPVLGSHIWNGGLQSQVELYSGSGKGGLECDSDGITLGGVMRVRSHP